MRHSTGEPSSSTHRCDSRLAWPGRLIALLALLTSVGCSTPRSVPQNVDSGTPAGGSTGTGGLGSGSGGASGGSLDAPQSGNDGVCASGTHSCSGRCVDDTAPATCGSSCEPCPSIAGAVSSCDGKRCSLTCSQGKKPCQGQCIAESDPCSTSCPQGFHDCGGICADNTKVATCGGACAACPSPPPGGVATCDGTKCDFRCEIGQRCGDKCGECCANADCPQQAGKVVTCDLSTLKCKASVGPVVDAGLPACAAGTRRCADSVCRANDEMACGDGCEKCPAPANAAASCDGVRCDFTCSPGSLRCQTQCLQQTGDVCCSDNDCPGRDNANVTCAQNRCSYACMGESVACEDMCIGLDQPTCCGADRSIDVNGNGTADCQENLVVNGQFAKDNFGWRAEPSVNEARLEWTPMDRAGSSSSGSIKVTNVYQGGPGSFAGAGFKRNVELKGGSTYYVVVDYYIPAGQAATGSAGIELDTNNSGFYETVELGRTVGAWTRAKVMVNVLSPDRFSSFRIDAVRETTTSPFTIYFDNVLLHR